jgi:quinol monooxygenase YgiN
MIFIVVKFTVRPEYADQWVEHVSTFTTATRSEAGNLWFEWSRSIENPHQYVLLEAFRDAAAGAEHVATEHFKTAVRELPRFLVGIPEIVNVAVPQAGWSQLAEMSPQDNSS